MACDLALRYDPTLRCCDLVWSGHDWQLDTTPATPMLVSLLAHRRAHADDAVPDAEAAPLAPPSLGARGGWPGDALDAQGRRTGSRIWLLSSAKATEQTRLLFEDYAAEGLEQVEADRGVSIALKVAWSALQPPGGKYLVAQAMAGATSVQAVQAVG